MRNGRPYYRPPKWKDPEQKPVRNHHFQPAEWADIRGPDRDGPDG